MVNEGRVRSRKASRLETTLIYKYNLLILLTLVWLTGTDYSRCALTPFGVAPKGAIAAAARRRRTVLFMSAVRILTSNYGLPKIGFWAKKKLAPRDGFEPPTNGLTESHPTLCCT